MQGWIQMIMTNFNEEAGNLNFLPSCHDCSMVVHEPGKPGYQATRFCLRKTNKSCEKSKVPFYKIYIICYNIRWIIVSCAQWDSVWD